MGKNGLMLQAVLFGFCCLLSVSGDNVLRLTVYDNCDYPRGWTMDGQGILVESPRRSVEGLLLFTAGSGRPDLLSIPVEGLYREPAWSRDNRLLAFIRSGEKDEELWLYERAGEGMRKLFQADTLSDIAWGDVGDNFVFCAGNLDERYLDVYLYEFSAGKARKLISNGRLNSHPVLSPSGKLLAYATKPQASLDIYQYDMQSGTNVPLLSGMQDERNPVWYSESVLLYLGEAGFRQEVFRYDFSSGKTRRMTNNNLTERGFLLSPDKTRLCFYDYTRPSSGKDHTDVFVLNLTGGPVKGFVTEKKGWEELWQIEKEACAIEDFYQRYEEIEKAGSGD